MYTPLPKPKECQTKQEMPIAYSEYDVIIDDSLMASMLGMLQGNMYTANIHCY